MQQKQSRKKDAPINGCFLIFAQRVGLVGGRQNIGNSYWLTTPLYISRRHCKAGQTGKSIGTINRQIIFLDDATVQHVRKQLAILLPCLGFHLMVAHAHVFPYASFSVGRAIVLRRQPGSLGVAKIFIFLGYGRLSLSNLTTSYVTLIRSLCINFISEVSHSGFCP